MNKSLWGKRTRRVWVLVRIGGGGHEMSLYETEADAKRAKGFADRRGVSIYPMDVYANSHDKDDPRVGAPEASA